MRIAVPVTTLWRDPGVVRAIDEPMVLAWPDPAAWLAGMEVRDRLDLLERADSQALLGEAAVLEEERAGWARVSLVEQPAGPHGGGYEGWVPRSHLEGAGPEDPDRRVVTRRLTELRAEPSGRVLTLVSLGSRFDVIDRSGDEVALRLAGGRVGWVRLDATEPEVARPAWSEDTPPAAIRRHVVDGAEQFLGVPYVWGGLSGYGVDCSGLVHLCCRMAGLRIPRDAHDQAAAPGVLPSGAAPPEDPGRCWLVYFARDPESGEGVHHVGLALDDCSMIHSPRTGRVVEFASYRQAPYAGEWYRGRDPLEFPTSTSA